MDLADSRQKISAKDCWVQWQMDEAMRHLPADLEVLPSPLLLEQMEREATQRQDIREGCSPLLRRSPPAPASVVKSTFSSRCRKRRRGAASSLLVGEEESSMSSAETFGAVVSLPTDVRAAVSNPASSSVTALSPRLAAAPPMPSSLAPAHSTGATPNELEERHARSRRISLLHPSPQLFVALRRVEEDYETAIRQFYCCPPPSSPGLQGAATEQPTPGLQGAATEQPTPGLQGAATEQPTPGLQGAATEQATSGLQSASAAAAVQQSTPGLQPAADFPPLFPVPEGSEGGLPLILAPGLSDCVLGSTDCVPGRTDAQPDTAQPDTPQPGMKPDSKPDPKSASTSSTRRRGRPSAHATEGLGDASTSGHTTEGLGDASASAHATKGLGDASAPAHATEGLCNASASVHATESFVLVLASEPRDKGFEEEAPPDLVHEGFKEQHVLVLASEPRDEGFE
ncbi:hypothetical protein CRENBAI_017879 [Crenichthys baileyi]|uniref:Uncharacterized protein n=1 Tax=Crenichthys baileyi TaxID=28760 RepID=A0AAV9RBD7_9TELE